MQFLLKHRKRSVQNAFLLRIMNTLNFVEIKRIFSGQWTVQACLCKRCPIISATTMTTWIRFADTCDAWINCLYKWLQIEWSRTKGNVRGRRNFGNEDDFCEKKNRHASLSRHIQHTYLAAVDVLDGCFAKHKVNKFTCFKATNELWTVQPFRIVLIGSNDFVILLCDKNKTYTLMKGFLCSIYDSTAQYISSTYLNNICP